MDPPIAGPASSPGAERTGTYRHIFILIHGTFARSARWTRPHSEMSVSLRRAFADSLVIPFDWTGSNSYGHRSDAASNLRWLLKKCAREHPNASLIIIAHSHGGNVAIRACEDRVLASKVRAIVTLATPFINCEARPLGSFSRTWRWALPMAAGIALFLVMGLIAGQLFSRFFPSPEPTIAFNILVLLIFIAAGWCFIRMRRYITKTLPQWAEERQKEIVRRVQPSKISLPVLCLTTSRDEAALWLRMWTLIANLPHGLWWLGSKLTGIALYFGVPAALYVTFLLKDPQAGSLVIWSALIYLIVIGAIATAMTAVMILFPLITRGTPLAFGWERPLDNLLMNIRAERLPTRAPRARHAPIKLGWAISLRHSRLYSDEDALKQLMQLLAGADAMPAPGR